MSAPTSQRLSHMDEWATARERMVVDQLERRGIRDARVLAAMRRVPRHLFVNPDQQANAYDDRALPIGLRSTEAVSAFSLAVRTPVSYTHLTLPTIYSV